MSKTKLIEGIDGTLTGKKIPFNPIADYSFKIVENNSRTIDFRTGTEYKVEIRLGASEFISDELFNKSKLDSYVLIHETHHEVMLSDHVAEKVSSFLFG
jgi:hypothetical protein